MDPSAIHLDADVNGTDSEFVDFVNNSTSDITVTNVYVEDDTASEFSLASNFNAPYTLGASGGFEGDRAFYQIYFSPKSEGSRFVKIVFETDSPESPHKFDVTATSEVPIVPDISVAFTKQPETSTVFDNHRVNEGVPDTLSATIKNAGNTDLIIDALEIAEGDNDQFVLLDTLYFPFTIGVQDSVVLGVQMNATAPISIPSPGISSISSFLKITHNDTMKTSPLEYQLKFIETAPNPETSGEWDFGSVLVGEDTTAIFTITNATNSQMDGDWVVNGLDFGQYSTAFSSTTSFPFTLGVGESQEVSVTYSAQQGLQSGQIQVEGNVSLSVDFQASGVTRELVLAIDTLDFGDVYTAQSTGQEVAEFTLEFTGGADVTITDLSISGADASYFDYFFSLPATVSADSNWPISFFPKNGTKGEKYAKVTITSNADNSPHEFIVAGNAVYPPELEAHTNQIAIQALERMTQLDTTLIISNSGSETLTINSLSLEVAEEYATQFQLVDGPATPFTLAGDDSLAINLRFAPTGDTDIYSDVVIVSNSTSATTTKIPLSAEVVYPVGVLIDADGVLIDELSFGDLSTVESLADTLYLVNKGTSNWKLGDWSVAGSSFFQVADPALVEPLDTAQLIISYDPATTGVHSAEITSSSNNFPSEITLNLTGTGIQPLLSFSQSIYVGESLIGDTLIYQQELENTSEYTATLRGATLSGVDAGYFQILNLEEAVSISEGTSYTLEIQFTPSEARVYEAQVQLVTNAVNGPLEATLTGTGTNAPKFFTPSDTVIVAEMMAGEETTLAVPVANWGTADLELKSAVLAAGSSGAFSQGADNDGFGLPKTLPGDGRDTIYVRFAPAYSGTHMGVLQIETNDQSASTNQPTYVATIYLLANVLGPKAEYDVASVTIDSAFVGKYAEKEFTITNTGQGDLTLDFLYPHPDSVFQLYYEGYETPTAPDAYTFVTIPEGQSQQAIVRFSPIEIGFVESNVEVVIRDARNERIYEAIPVSGNGYEPPVVEIGGLTFEGDRFIREGNIKTLMGNVHVGDLELGEEVAIDLVNQTISGDGDVQVTGVPANGALAGGTVKLRTGGFFYHVNGNDNSLSLSANKKKGKDFFEVIGLTMEINDLKINEKGVCAGGGLSLPEIVFGPDAGFKLDNVLISKSDGIDIAGTFNFESPVTIYEAFSLESVEVSFDSFKECFTGKGTLATQGVAFEMSIDAEVILKKGGLDGVALEVETMPGVPLGQSGFALAGGNGAIKGLRVPPVSMALGVDLIPVAPGLHKLVRFNNVGFEYTFGNSLEAGGTMQLYGMDVANAKIAGKKTVISAEAFVELLGVFKGNARISMEPFGEKLNLSGNASLAYTIPAMQEGFPDFVRGAVNSVLPITVAEVSTSFDEKRITGAAVYPPIPFRLSATITLDDDKPKLTFGAEFTLLNNESGKSNGRLRVGELPYLVAMEHDAELMSQNHLEGQSITINSRVDPRGRSLQLSETVFPFSLTSEHEAVIIRVEGETEVPSFSLRLPTGQEVTASNAEAMGYAYTTYEPANQAHILMSKTLVGDYEIVIEGTGNYQLDIAGASFGPGIELMDPEHQEEADEVIINWTDSDLDSDAEISLFYDTDEQGADGQLIVADLSEDDPTDSYTWDVSALESGNYYVYAVIDDGVNVPVTVYAQQPVSIERVSAVESPELLTATGESEGVRLEWSKVAEAAYYRLYLAEEGEVTKSSRSHHVGNDTVVVMPELTGGRNYQFAISAVANGVESELSNVLNLQYLTANNTPQVAVSGMREVKVGVASELQVVASDADGDELELTLVTGPDGMALANSVLSWTPEQSQVGMHRVKLRVSDGQVADSLEFDMTVIDEQSSRAAISFDQNRYYGTGAQVNVNLQDQGLNQEVTARESATVSVFSTEDQEGFTLTLMETGVNTGTFSGAYQLGESTQDGVLAVGTADTLFITYTDAYPQEEVQAIAFFQQSTETNALPTAIELSNKVVSGNVKAGDIVGVLSTTDSDDDTHTYRLVAGTGDEHNAYFKLDGQALQWSGDLSSLTSADSLLSIRVRTQDPKNGIYEQKFELTVESILNATEPDKLPEIKAYPNPTHGRLIVKMDSRDEAVAISLMNANGKTVIDSRLETKRFKHKATIDLENLPAGIYFLHVKHQNQVVIKRIVKQ
ncbi:putative secreted protein (Por secretion system target) [Marinoscillum furvescens DSM 4134]|uniref:Putative secreted protein (Por secretion system target) n=2 Tax=Marinoscillum furvescens TaxID=1026 RepID=A0A3D9KZ77_MARFU|nr:putative secreted protein (Por secretion system target) [Marinoscillum furvescens DSM 4134]